MISVVLINTRTRSLRLVPNCDLPPSASHMLGLCVCTITPTYLPVLWVMPERNGLAALVCDYSQFKQINLLE